MAFELANDRPVSDPQGDLLHRQPFVEQLAQSILSVNAHEGFVFAVTGPWGSGKTTVLNFVENFLRKPKDDTMEGRDRREFRGRIVVVIDDIDRLTPDEIRLVFRLVKAVANFPQTIYLLAYDGPVITHALGDPGLQDGKDYLDKIVQLSLPLPTPIQSSLQTMISNGFNEIIKDLLPHLFNPKFLGPNGVGFSLTH